MYRYAGNVGKKVKSVMFNDYSITVEEFDRIKDILAKQYKKCLDMQMPKKMILETIEKKMEYFRMEGFFDFYEIKGIRKNVLKIVVNVRDALYEIALTEE